MNKPYRKKELAMQGEQKSHFSYKAGLRTGFANSGRYAGAGVSYDDYSDDCEQDYQSASVSGKWVKFPHDAEIEKREDWEKLNGPVIVISAGK